jgi:hypothetical protein
LVFADWLQEHGEEPRAEFIRAQIAAASATPRKARLLKARADGLLAQHRQRWLAELPREHGWVWGEVFVRGFVEELFVGSEMPTPPHDPDTAPAFAATPIVTFEIVENTIRPWIRHFRHVRTLAIYSCPLTLADTTALCSPDLGMRPTRVAIHTYAQIIDEDVIELLRARFGDALDENIERVE